MIEDTRELTGRNGIERAPRGVGLGLAVVVALLLSGGLYLILVRGDAIFLDLAALSGLMFCF